MKLGHYNMYTGALTAQQLASILATGYILADGLLLLGDVEYYLTIAELPQKLTTVQKLKLLISQHENDSDPEKQELVKQLKKTKDHFHKFNNSKNKDTALIVAIRRMEGTITKMYQEVIDAIQDIQAKWGITAIMNLLDQKDFASYFININTPEENPNNDSFRKFVSEALLMNIYDENAEFDMYLLSKNFVSDEFRENRGCYAVFNEKAVTDDLGYVFIAFELPIITVCSTNELKLLRAYFKQHGTCFREVIDGWLLFCKQSTNYKARIDHFIAHVIPAIDAFKTVIANNNILNFVANRNDVNYQTIQVCFGETSMQSIWDYNRYAQNIPDESWQKITDAAKANPEFAKMRVPFMSVGYYNKSTANIDVPNNEPINEEASIIQPTKKSLNID